MKPVGTTVSLIADAGLEVRDVHALREHYQWTAQAWLRTLESRWDDAVAMIGEVGAGSGGCTWSAAGWRSRRTGWASTRFSRCGRTSPARAIWSRPAAAGRAERGLAPARSTRVLARPGLRGGRTSRRGTARRPRRSAASAMRHAERHLEAVLERPGDQRREEGLTGEGGHVGAATGLQVGSGRRPASAARSGSRRGKRRTTCPPAGSARWSAPQSCVTPSEVEAVVHGRGQRVGQADRHQREEPAHRDSTMPAFIPVARTPDAAPRWSGGTEFMMAAELGAAIRPEPMPLTANSSGEHRVGEVRPG